MWSRSRFDFRATKSERSCGRRSKHTLVGRRAARRLFLESLEGRSLMAFNVLAEYPTASDYPREILLAPINADSQLDLVTVDGRVDIRPGNGDGSFGDLIDPASAINAYKLTTGDFNADGITDLAAISGNAFSVRVGKGDGTFQNPSSFTLPAQLENAFTGSGYYSQGASSIVAGDLNDDGKLDLVVGGVTTFPGGLSCGYYSCGYFEVDRGYVNVLLGNGAGSFDYVD